MTKAVGQYGNRMVLVLHVKVIVEGLFVVAVGGFSPFYSGQDVETDPRQVKAYEGRVVSRESSRLM